MHCVYRLVLSLFFPHTTHHTTLVIPPSQRKTIYSPQFVFVNRQHRHQVIPQTSLLLWCQPTLSPSPVLNPQRLESAKESADQEADLVQFKRVHGFYQGLSADIGIQATSTVYGTLISLLHAVHVAEVLYAKLSALWT